MKVKRLNTVTQVEKLSIVEYELPKTDCGKFIVDDSNFIPMSEAIKQLGVNGAGADDGTLAYDFIDGNDNGMPVPISRRKDIRDIAEISSEIMADVDKAAKTIEEVKTVQKKQKDFEKALASVKPDVVNTPKE